MDRKDIVDFIRKHKLIAIIRTSYGARVPRLMDALYKGGIRVMEVTLNTPSCFSHMAHFADKSDVLVGAGTVLSGADINKASEAGAQFFVSPIASEEMVQAAHGLNKAILCGAYTPNEIYQAYQWGSDFVKVFPANGLGPSYIKAVRAPLPMLPLAPTGGVNAENAQEWLAAGSIALGVGSGLLPSSLIENESYDEITALATRFCGQVHSP